MVFNKTKPKRSYVSFFSRGSYIATIVIANKHFVVFYN